MKRSLSEKIRRANILTDKVAEIIKSKKHFDDEIEIYVDVFEPESVIPKRIKKALKQKNPGERVLIKVKFKPR